jgi:hypothetical protein
MPYGVNRRVVSHTQVGKDVDCPSGFPRNAERRGAKAPNL